MPSTTNAARPTSKSDRYSRPDIDSDALEDQKLLGTYRDHGKSSVIRTPGKAEDIGSMSRRTVQGGVKPMNTLSRKNELSNIRSRRDTLKNTSMGKPTALRVETVSGNNVRSGTTSASSANQSTRHPPAKRQKVPHAGPPIRLDSSPSSDGSVGKVSAGRLNTRTTRKKPPDEHPGGVQEFRNVENYMRTDPPKRRKKASPHLTDGQPGLLFPLKSRPLDCYDSEGQLRRSSVEDVDELQQSDYAPPKILRSAVRQAATPHRNGQEDDPLKHAGGETSKYFQSSKTLSNESSHEILEIKEAAQEEASLQKSFISVGGKRRGQRGSSSSQDELTSGRNAEIISRGRGQSPRKRLRVDDDFDVAAESGVAPSNIKSTKFRANNTKGQREKLDETPGPWAVDVAAVSLPSNDTSFVNTGLGLVCDKDEENYTLLLQGKPFTRVNCIVNPAKLIKILYEEDGTKIRFKSSQQEGEACTLDIELSRKIDMASLLQHMQRQRAILCVGKTSEWMENAFQLRRKKESDFLSRQPKKPEVSSHRNLQPSNQGMSHKIWKERMAAENQSQSSRTPKATNGLNTADDGDDNITFFQKPLGGETSSKPNSKSSSGIDSILQRLNPNPASKVSSMRRSTRASGLFASRRDLVRLSPEEEAPLKFSKTVGLGAEWKKPLTYPKNGRKQATVDWVDLEKLDEGEFLNDALVTFYMRFLEHELAERDPAMAKRIYFYSTFFYERLTNFQKGKKDINYSAVQKWTKNVDIFTYDYLVIPINESAHWYLAIICNLPALDRTFSISDDEAPQQKDLEAVDIFAVREENDASGGDPPLARPSQSPGNQTTESFAELSLMDMTGTDRETLPAPKQMVNVPEIEHDKNGPHDGNDTTPNGNGLDQVKGEQSNNDIDALGQSKLQQLTSQTSPKKGKRKSMPAVTHTNPTQPLILTFDSLGAPRSTTVRYLKDYLLQEGKAKRGGMEIDLGSIKGITAKAIPQQNNFSDCGVYTLGYLNKFMRDGPEAFVAKVVKRQYTDADWSELVPSKMRSALRDQLFKLYEIQDREVRAARADRKSQESETQPSSPLGEAGHGHLLLTAKTASQSPHLRDKHDDSSTTKALEDRPSTDGAVLDSRDEANTKVQDKGLDDSKNCSGQQEQEIDTENASLIILGSQQPQPKPDAELSFQKDLLEYIPPRRTSIPRLPEQIADSQEKNGEVVQRGHVIEKDMDVDRNEEAQSDEAHWATAQTSPGLPSAASPESLQSQQTPTPPTASQPASGAEESHPALLKASDQPMIIDDSFEPEKPADEPKDHDDPWRLKDPFPTTYSRRRTQIGRPEAGKQEPNPILSSTNRVARKRLPTSKSYGDKMERLRRGKQQGSRGGDDEGQNLKGTDVIKLDD